MAECFIEEGGPRKGTKTPVEVQERGIKEPNQMWQTF